MKLVEDGEGQGIRFEDSAARREAPRIGQAVVTMLTGDGRRHRLEILYR